MGQLNSGCFINSKSLSERPVTRLSYTWILKEADLERDLTYKFRMVILPNTSPSMELGSSTEIFRNDLTAVRPSASWSILYQDQHCSGSKILVKRQALWSIPTEHTDNS